MTDRSRQTAVVTGGSRGLGRELVLGLAERGWDVVFSYRQDLDAAREVATSARTHGGSVDIVQADLSDPAGFDELRDVVAGTSSLDALVLNAAATAFRPLDTVGPTHLQKTLQVSVLSSFDLVQAARAGLAASRGTVLAVSGEDVRSYVPGHGLLAAAKSALETLVRYLACESGEAFSAVAVSPGWMFTDSLKQLLGPTVPYAEKMEVTTHPLHESAGPEHIAKPILDLLGRDLRWFSGQTIQLDGSGVFSFGGRYFDVAGMLLEALGEEPG